MLPVRRRARVGRGGRARVLHRAGAHPSLCIPPSLPLSIPPSLPPSLPLDSTSETVQARNVFGIDHTSDYLFHVKITMKDYED